MSPKFCLSLDIYSKNLVLYLSDDLGDWSIVWHHFKFFTQCSMLPYSFQSHLLTDCFTVRSWYYVFSTGDSCFYWCGWVRYWQCFFLLLFLVLWFLSWSLVWTIIFSRFLCGRLLLLILVLCCWQRVVCISLHWWFWMDLFVLNSGGCSSQLVDFDLLLFFAWHFLVCTLLNWDDDVYLLHVFLFCSTMCNSNYLLDFLIWPQFDLDLLHNGNNVYKPLDMKPLAML